MKKSSNPKNASYSNQVTFVTTFMDIYNGNENNKSLQFRIEKFRDVASTGIKICIYVDSTCEGLITNILDEFENIKKMKVLSVSDMWVSKKYREQSNIELPEMRSHVKDTVPYMLLMNAKSEFLYDAAVENPWSSTHFAWIDLNISYILNNLSESQERLVRLSQNPYLIDGLFIAGCWNIPNMDDIDSIINRIHWRFCGGFLIGDRKSILELYLLYREHFVYFLNTYKILCWEVNFWAWLEANGHWSPIWYSADHNDRILHVPMYAGSRCLLKDSILNTYSYDCISNYEPMSAAYLYYGGCHYLNTRYVNYRLSDSGHYQFATEDTSIYTKNVLSELSETDFTPYRFEVMSEDSITLPKTTSMRRIYGLEDIRLYVCNDVIRFIASNVNYSPSGQNRMIVGDYCIDTLSFLNSRVITPPNVDSWCEKNWIPITRENSETEETEEWFIYKWFPMEIGRIDPFTNQLNIEIRHVISAPEFHRVRGSTCFVDNGEWLIGLVHFSEETTPRQYYHILVALERYTFKPRFYSEIFHFQHIGIEFCIGMAIHQEDYLFWVSKMDREPAMLRMPMRDISMKFEFI
jgi:hypothetical protein